MSLFTWSEEYSVGVPELDAQHKQLVATLNELYQAMSAGQARQALGAILIRLVGYTQQHFADEERRMSARRYPGLLAHQAEHERFANRVLEFQRKFESGAASINVELGVFLKQWLQHHILKVDKMYSSCLSAAQPA